MGVCYNSAIDARMCVHKNSVRKHKVHKHTYEQRCQYLMQVLFHAAKLTNYAYMCKRVI